MFYVTVLIVKLCQVLLENRKIFQQVRRPNFDVSHGGTPLVEIITVNLWPIDNVFSGQTYHTAIGDINGVASVCDHIPN